MSERCKHGKLPENPCWECDEEPKDYQVAKQPLTMNWIKRMFCLVKENDDHAAREFEGMRHLGYKIEELTRTIMIAQASLDASLASLTTAVNTAVAALATISTSTSTPDAVVAAYQAGVDAQTVALAAGTPVTPVTPPTP